MAIGRRPVVQSEVEQESSVLPVTITPDEVFKKIQDAESEYERAERDLIVFVEEQVEKMKCNLLFNGREPTFYDLQTTLSSFETVALGLTSLYATVRAAHDYAQESYDDVFAAKYAEERQKRVALKKDYASTREIELAVRSTHMRELAELRANVLSLDTKRNFVERLIKNWEGYGFVLNTLSANARAEAAASGISAANLPNLGE
jgi:hypothetical protein